MRNILRNILRALKAIALVPVRLIDGTISFVRQVLFGPDLEPVVEEDDWTPLPSPEERSGRPLGERVKLAADEIACGRKPSSLDPVKEKAVIAWLSDMHPETLACIGHYRANAIEDHLDGVRKAPGLPVFGPTATPAQAITPGLTAKEKIRALLRQRGGDGRSDFVGILDEARASPRKAF